MKILLVGTIVATMTCAGAATSQTPPPPSTADNIQVQLGDVFATQTLNVVDVSGSTTAATTATGNSFSAAVQNGSMNMTSSQTMQGNVTATTQVTAAGSAGDGVTLITEAAGNTGEGSVTGGTMNATVNQTVHGTAINASTVVDAPTGQMFTSSNISATALGNSQAYGVTDGTATHSTTQSNDALVQALAGAQVQYLQGDSAVSASAVANNVSGGGLNSTQTASVTQTMTGARTQASVEVESGSAWNVIGASVATANNANIGNQGGSLAMTVNQTNGDYVRSESLVNAYEFGAGTASAVGIGNSSQAGEAGGFLDFDNTQSTTGGVQVFSTFTGHDGFDAGASSIAIGNATTGYACSDCQATMRINNHQTNTDGVEATSTVSIAGSNRSVSSTANAVGNSATFFVTTPH